MSRCYTAAILRRNPAAALASCFAGWQLHNDAHQATPAHVNRVFTGTVTIVNEGIASGCVRPDGSSKPVCAALVANPGIRAGQHVRVASTQVSTGGGNGYRLLIVLPDGPG